MRMPRYQEMRPTTGAYVAFYCESCGASFDSSPDVGGAIGNQVKNALLRDIPVIGWMMGGTAQTIDRDAHWAQVQGQFAECVQCKKIVCRGCYDGAQQKCRSCKVDQAAQKVSEHLGQAASGAAAAMGMAMGGLAAGLGALGGAAGMAMVECPSCHKSTLRAPRCQNCGQAIPEAMLKPGKCAKCGSGMMPGSKFCPSCGAPAA